MKKILVAITILFSISICAQNKQTIVVDGNLNDWSYPMQYYDSETKLNYSIAYADSAFFFCIQAIEENTQMHLLKVGFQISLDPKGKKKQKFNLVYKPQMMSVKDKPEKPSIENLKKEFTQKPIIVSLSGFTGIANDTYLTSHLKEIQFAMGWDSLNFLCIEYKIPFSLINYQPTERDASLGIILFAMEMPTVGVQPNGGMRGNPPSDMSPPQGGGMPPRGGVNSMRDMFVEKKVWTKFNVLNSK